MQECDLAHYCPSFEHPADEGNAHAGEEAGVAATYLTVTVAFIAANPSLINKRLGSSTRA